MNDTMLPVDAQVECTDGHAGFVSTIIIDPVHQAVTHIVVKTSKDSDHKIPVDQIERTDQETIYLKCSLAELNQMDIFTETHYVKSGNPDYSMYMSGAYESPYVTNIEEDYVPVEEEQVPVGELAIHRGTKVEATDGDVGILEEFIVDANTGKVSHFILRKGHLWGQRDVTIPMTAVDHSEGDKVFLTLDKEAIAALPSVKVKRHHVL